MKEQKKREGKMNNYGGGRTGEKREDCTFMEGNNGREKRKKGKIGKKTEY